MSATSAVNAGRGVGEPGPEPKRRRLLDAGGPIEDVEVARQKMRDAQVYERGVGGGTFRGFDGFDPDNVADVKTFLFGNTDGSKSGDVKPMGYFAQRGDLPMMRWLHVNGADTRDVDLHVHFPMFSAVMNGRIELCQWLYDHGAAKDIKRRTLEQSESSPLLLAFLKKEQNLSRWLILNGALCKDDDSGNLDVKVMKQDLDPNLQNVPKLRRDELRRERVQLLEWANDLYRPRTSFLLFLSGALSDPEYACSTRRNVSSLQLLAGKPGIRELIGDYVGFVRGREACIIRQLTEKLPDLI